MPTRKSDHYGTRLLAVLSSIDDEQLLTREAMRQALGFPNVAQVSQMLNQGNVPSGDRVLRLLNAELPVEVRRRVLSLVGDVLDATAGGEAAAAALGGHGAERVRSGLLSVMQLCLDLLPWAVRLERMEDGLEGCGKSGGSAMERALESEWATKMAVLKRMRETVEGVGFVCDEMAMRPGRVAARTPELKLHPVDG